MRSGEDSTAAPTSDSRYPLGSTACPGQSPETLRRARSSPKLWAANEKTESVGTRGHLDCEAIQLIERLDDAKLATHVTAIEDKASPASELVRKGEQPNDGYRPGEQTGVTDLVRDDAFADHLRQVKLLLESRIASANSWE